jgi:phosphoglycolate phosphatase
MVGDSRIDIDAARAAGVRVAAVTYGFRPKDELAAASPDFLLDRFDQLTEVVR